MSLGSPSNFPVFIPAPRCQVPGQAWASGADFKPDTGTLPSATTVGVGPRAAAALPAPGSLPQLRSTRESTPTQAPAHPLRMSRNTDPSALPCSRKDAVVSHGSRKAAVPTLRVHSHERPRGPVPQALLPESISGTQQLCLIRRRPIVPLSGPPPPTGAQGPGHPAR